MNKRVLVVEDNADDEELTLLALQEGGSGFDVDVVRDGAEARAYLSGRPAGGALPDLVLMDMNLPKVNGIELVEQMRADPALALIPVVMLTTSSESGDLKGAYRAGANSYIVKPVDFARFVSTIGCVSRYWLDLNHMPPMLAV